MTRHINRRNLQGERGGKRERKTDREEVRKTERKKGRMKERKKESVLRQESEKVLIKIHVHYTNTTFTSTCYNTYQQVLHLIENDEAYKQN